jgi:uncharacterized protein YceK
MKKPGRVLWSMVIPLVLSGCGTVINFREEHCPIFHPDDLALPRSVYGGLILDAGWIGQGITTPSEHPVDPLQACEFVALMTQCITDMPFSLIGDTVTLPFTIYASWLRSQPLDEQVNNSDRK